MMYVLIKLSGDEDFGPYLVSDRKSKLVSKLKDIGYYWSPKLKRYIDDKTAGNGGSGTDYIISKIEEL